MSKDKNQKIFEYFLDEHNLTLLQSDIDAIVNLVNKELDKELCDTYMKLNATNSANAGYQELNENLEAENQLLKEQLLNKSEIEQALQSALEENKELNETVKQATIQIQENNKRIVELHKQVINAHNLLMGKDARIALITKSCNPLVIEDACTLINSLYLHLIQENTKQILLSDEFYLKVMNTGKALQDYQEGKENSYTPINKMEGVTNE